MATYRTTAELQGKTLAQYDFVNLDGLSYIVRVSHLENIQGANSKIFAMLDIEDKYAFAAKHYEYRAFGGDWPVFRHSDYPALTRLVLALYELWEAKFRRTIYYTVTEEQYDYGGPNGLITLRLYEVKNNRIVFVAAIETDTDSSRDYPEEILEWQIDNEDDEGIIIERLY